MPMLPTRFKTTCDKKRVRKDTSTVHSPSIPLWSIRMRGTKLSEPPKRASVAHMSGHRTLLNKFWISEKMNSSGFCSSRLHTEHYVGCASWRTESTLRLWKDLFYQEESMQKYLRKFLVSKAHEGDVTIVSADWAVSCFKIVKMLAL